MREVKSFNGTCLYHCESDTICRKGQEKLEEEGPDGLPVHAGLAFDGGRVHGVHGADSPGGADRLPVHYRPRQPVPNSGGDPDGPAARRADLRRILPAIFLPDRRGRREARAVGQIHPAAPPERGSRRDARGARKGLGGYPRHRSLPSRQGRQGKGARQYSRGAVRPSRGSIPLPA